MAHVRPLFPEIDSRKTIFPVAYAVRSFKPRRLEVPHVDAEDLASFLRGFFSRFFVCFDCRRCVDDLTEQIESFHATKNCLFSFYGQKD